ncbi:MAG: homoserine kinase [Nitrososphaerales archaeon]
MAKIAVRAPSTIANLGPGYDVFGIALDKPFDIVRVEETGKRKVVIDLRGPYASTIPKDPRENSAGLAATSILKSYSINSGVRIVIEKHIPPGMGLGSSGASSAAVTYALNQLFRIKLDDEKLIGIAALGERASSGVEHADNVAPAITGGFVIIKSYSPLKINSMKPPRDLIFSICSPKIRVKEKKTKLARGLVPLTVDIKRVSSNIGHASSMAVGFASGNVELIGDSMVDSIVEPARAQMIPGYHDVRRLAMKAGALGVAICGAGPSMFGLTKSMNLARKIANAMRDGFSEVGVDSESFVARPGIGVEEIKWN